MAIEKYKEAVLAVTSTQVTLLVEPMGKTKALARVTLNDSMLLTGLRVVDGMNGLFVAYPNDPGYKGDAFRSLFYPVTRELRTHIEDVVIAAYQAALKGKPLPDHSSAYRWAFDHTPRLTAEEKEVLACAIERRGSLEQGYLGRLEEEIGAAEHGLAVLKERRAALQDGSLVAKLKAKIAKRFGPKGPLVLADEDSKEGHKTLSKLVLEGTL